MKSHTPYSPRQIRNIRIGSVVSLLLYLHMIFIPLVYEWRPAVPPMAQLQVARGELTFQDVGKGDRLTGIKSATGTTFFSCATGKIGHPNCLFDLGDYEKLAGKQATLWWYEQPIYLFTTQKRVVRLIVNEEEKISYEKTALWTEKSASRAPWYIFIVLVIVVSIVVGFELKIRRERHEQ